MDADNLAKLENLDVPSILSVIKTRYQKGEIYTKCGEIIIAVNPFRDVGIYTDYHHELYKHEYWSKTLKPHIFFTAECALQNMLESYTNQAIIVSGESGSGKTESTKYMLQHLMYSSMGNKESPLQKRIIQVNPLLEAFGNAQTAMNRNSSRFGKYTEVCFNTEGRVIGAIIRDYMLEKSRLVYQCPGEGNFHVFYAFFAGADLKQYELAKLINYRILRNTDVSLIKDIHRFKNLYIQIITIFRNLRFTDEDINTVERILAAVIHLTQVEFSTDSAEGICVKSMSALVTVAGLLNLDVEQLHMALMNKTLKMPDESVATPKNKKQADEGRDALAKALYERLFGWIVRKINEGIMPVTKEGCTIGILDISGFENLKRNSFEQLCINVINERLQNYLNKHIFECEKLIYMAEGVDLDAGGIDFRDNEGLLAMLMQPPCCILNIINEESHLPETNYKTLAQKMNVSFGKYPHYRAPEGTSGNFCIQHFAGEVWYNTYSFLEKNKDELSQDLVACLQDSYDDFISDLFTVKKGPTGTISVTPFQYRPSRKITLDNNIRQENRSQRRTPKVQVTKSDKTIISYLKASLESLLQKLDESEPHFVRCIKPNDFHRPDAFNEEKVKEQLIYSGVAEAAKIRKCGFPYRLTFQEFIQRYGILTKYMRSLKDEKKQVKAMLSYLNIDPQQYRLGTYKVFLKQQSYLYIGKCVKIRKTLSAIQIQRFWKLMKLRKQKKKDLETGMSILRKRHVTTEKKSVKLNLQNDSHMSEGGLTLDSIDSNLGLIAGEDRASYKRRQRGKKSSPKKKQNASDGEEQNKNEADEEEDFQPWDIFQNVADEPDTSTLQHTTLIKLIKIVLYLFLFSIVLGTTVTQKLSFFALLKQHKSWAEKRKDEFFTLILIAVCIPYGLTVAISMGKVLFGSKRTVSLKTAIKVLLIETVHTVSLSLLVFHILIKLEVVPGILIMNSTAFIPSLLRALFPVNEINEPPPNENTFQGNTSKIWKRTLIRFFDILSCVIQLACLITFVVFLDNSNWKWYDKLECVLSFLFVSISWWENFYDGCSVLSMFNRSLMEIKYELQDVRHFMNMITYTWKIVLTVLCAYLLGNQQFSVDFSEKSIEDDINPYLPIILLTLCTGFGYYFAYLACKLCMQEMAFSIPLFLSTPVTIIIAEMDCWGSMTITKDTPFKYLNECWKIERNNDIVTMAVGILLYISIYWIVRYIYKSEQSRLLRRDLLFLNPYYCSVFYEQGILMSRRRHQFVIKHSTHNGRCYYKLEKHEDSDVINTAEIKGKKYYPKVYACATMWHETPNEMMQILKSIFRMSIEQQIRKDMKELENDDEGYFEFEAHIFFDDAMTFSDDDEVVVNKFVDTFVSKVDEAASSVMKIPVKLEPPAKIITPYGGQLLWVLQSDVLLYVHLKDKNKIRHRKRWSQVMYMYYLLGHRLTKVCEDDLLKKIKNNPDIQTDIFEFLNDDVNKTAENTFLLALDGDVDFNPDSVKLLIDLMLKNKKVGAACGRIHPIGSGPIVWFQIFEYAVGHWLQKATEHVLGCVLCSPGCFSLFRGSALMDTNVMRKYTILPTEPKHYLQYDQGEDRWLCTLLLQQGYRVDYCAAADAYTYAPDTFNEFFNQRRRWMPSTIANILDLLSSYKRTVQKNNNISTLYIAYQFVLMLSTMIGPATVMMMIATALTAVFGLSVLESYILVLIPNMLYTLLCFYASSKTQINVALVLTAIYSFIMMAVLVGVVIQAVKTSLFNPGVAVITAMVILFVFTAMLHPQEMTCLVPGLLYFLCIPSGYLLLVIYSLCNMHVVSWGTREVKAKLTKKQLEQAKRDEELQSTEKKRSIFSKFFQNPGILELSEMFKNSQMKKDRELLKALQVINTNISKLLSAKEIEAEEFPAFWQKQETTNPAVKKRSLNNKNDDEDSEELQQQEASKEDSLIPSWANGLGKGIIVDLNEEEKNFWKGFIKKYLYPINPDKDEEKKAQNELLLFRTNMCFGMIMVNLLWMAINFMFQDKQPSQIEIGGEDIDMFSFLFLLFFTAFFAIQFLGMLMHRWGTFLHVISYTTIGNPFRKKQQQDKTLNKDCCREIIRKLRYEPVPDYDDRVEINKVQKEFEERVENHILKTAQDMQEEKNIEKNIEHKNIGCVIRKSLKRENTTIGLTMYRKVTSPARRTESRFERKEAPVGIGSRKREQRKNLQFVSRKNLKKDMDRRLLRQSRVEFTSTPNELAPKEK